VPKRGVVRTYLFADLRDYTSFVEMRGDAAATRLLRAYRTLFRAEIRRSRGAEIKTEGDSFYVVFRTPGDAVRCALGVMRRARRHLARHSDLPLRIGIGINTGESEKHDKGYVGSAVILASRLAGQAEAGRVLVTDTVRSLVRTGALAPMRDLGTWKLKGVAQSVHVYEVETTDGDGARAVGPALRLPALLTPPPLRGATGLVVCPELVQREKPLAGLLDQLGAAAQGQSRFVALTGEAGVGKSRLVRELARIAHDDGFYVFGGRSHASAATPYEPFVAALRPYVQARGSEILRRVLGSLVTELGRLLPELDVVATDTAHVLPDDERRERFFRAAQLMLEDAAALRPVLLVLEDAHEADTATRDLLRYLATNLHVGICLVFTYREEDVRPTDPLRALVAELDRERRLMRVSVDPLDAYGVAQMARAMVPDRWNEALVTSVLERSEGVPFFVEELLKTALDDPAAGPGRLPLPRTVRDSVQTRVSRLAEEHGRGIAELLELAAVAGVPLGYELLVRMSGRAEAAASEDLAACVEAQLLERPPTQTEIYQFRHTLTRDAIENAIPQSRRRRLHLRIAEALEASPGDARARASALAKHYAEGGEPARSIRYGRDAAKAATALGAYATAIELLREAAGHALGLGEEPEVLEELAAALQAAGRAHEAEDAIVRARELFASRQDTEHVARLDVRLANVLRMQGRRGEAVIAVKRAIEVLRDRHSDDLVDAIVTHANLAWAAMDAAQAANLAREALAVGDGAGSTRAAVAALSVLGAALARLNDPEGTRILREAIRRGRDAGLHAEVVSAYLELGRAERRVGNWEEAGVATRAGLEVARERGLEFTQARLLAQLGYIYFSQGRLNEARAVAEQSVALAEPGNIAALGAMTTLADVLSQQGDYTAALAILDQVTPHIERADPDLQAAFLSQRARPLAGLGRLDEAAAAVRRGVDLYLQGPPGGGITTFLIAGEIFEARRDAEEVRRLIADAERHFSGNDAATVRVLRHELAAILVRCERGDAATLFSRVADEYEALGVPLRAAHRRATAAIERLRDPAIRASARRELAGIRAELLSRGALRYVAAIDAASRTTAVVRRTQAGGALSGRDVQVALLISRGLTNRAISSELGVTSARAAALVRAVLQRLGVARRSQVAGWVIQRLGAEMGGAVATK